MQYSVSFPTRRSSDLSLGGRGGAGGILNEGEVARSDRGYRAVRRVRQIVDGNPVECGESGARITPGGHSLGKCGARERDPGPAILRHRLQSLHKSVSPRRIDRRGGASRPETSQKGGEESRRRLEYQEHRLARFRPPRELGGDRTAFAATR